MSPTFGSISSRLLSLLFLPAGIAMAQTNPDDPACRGSPINIPGSCLAPQPQVPDPAEFPERRGSPINTPGYCSSPLPNRFPNFADDPECQGSPINTPGYCWSSVAGKDALGGTIASSVGDLFPDPANETRCQVGSGQNPGYCAVPSSKVGEDRYPGYSVVTKLPRLDAGSFQYCVEGPGGVLRTERGKVFFKCTLPLVSRLADLGIEHEALQAIEVKSLEKPSLGGERSYLSWDAGAVRTSATLTSFVDAKPQGLFMRIEAVGIQHPSDVETLKKSVVANFNAKNLARIVFHP